MKKSGTQALADKLLSQIFTSAALNEVSISLENIAQDRHLKTHAAKIVTDGSLNLSQKKRQLNYLLSGIENSIVNSFFSDQIGAGDLWLFDSEKIDYLDEFIQLFQRTTQTASVLHLTTASTLTQNQMRIISQDLTQEFGYKVIINHQQNPSLLGGIQVKIDNYVFDFSLRTKFQQFQREWLASLEKTTKLVGRYDLEV